MAGVRAWHCRLCQMTTSLFLVLSVRIPRSLSIARFHHRWSSLVHLSGFHLIIVSLFKSENYFSHLLSLVLKVIVWSHSCQYKINQPFASSPSLVCVSPSTLQKHLSLSFCSPKLRCCNHLFLLSLRFTYTILTETSRKAKWKTQTQKERWSERLDKYTTTIPAISLYGIASKSSMLVCRIQIEPETQKLVSSLTGSILNEIKPHKWVCILYMYRKLGTMS